MKRFKSIVMAALALIVAGAYALPSAPALAQSSSALSIAPKKNYVIEPGKSVEDKLIIRNADKVKPLELTLRVVDFSYTDNGGTPKLFLDPNAAQTTWSLKPFMTLPKTVTIPANGTKSLDMKVAIPKGHGAGSYYSAIIYSSGGGSSEGGGANVGGNVGLSASGVTLVFTQIPGKVSENLTLKKFGAYQNNQNDGAESGYMNFTMKEPLNMAYTLKNNGNVTEAPVGSITLKSMFGQEYTINDVNPTGSLALIGQTRTYSTCIKITNQDVDLQGSNTKTKGCVSPGLWPGLYTAKLDLFYGQNGNETQEIQGSTWFWYLPWWFIILVVVILALIAFGIWRVTNKVKTTRSRRVRLNKARK